MRRRAFRAILPSGRGHHDSAAHDGVAFVENGRLAPGDPEDGFVQLQFESLRRLRHRRGDGVGAIAELGVHATHGDIERTVRLDAAARKGLVRADDDAVRGAVGVEHVQRALRDDADAAALARRVSPCSVVRTEAAARLVDDGAARRLETVAGEKRAVVVAGEKARLLALGAPGYGEAGTFRLRARRLLVLVAEREDDAIEMHGVELREHVGLILGARCAREQRAAPMLHRARVVPGGEAVAPGAVGELEQLPEAEAAVAVDARVRRLAARVATYEVADDLVAEGLAQIEGDVRQAEAVARLARGDDRLGRAARALCVAAGGIEPQAERHADGVGERTEERDGAVHAAAHRHGGAAWLRVRAEDPADGVRECVGDERLAWNGGRLEQREPRELRPVRVDDAVAVDDEANARPLPVAGGVSVDVDHGRGGPGPREPVETGGYPAAAKTDAGSLHGAVGSPFGPDPPPTLPRKPPFDALRALDAEDPHGGKRDRDRQGPRGR